MQSRPSRASEERIISPFSDVDGALHSVPGKSKTGLWIGLTALIFTIVLVGGGVVIRHLNDPLRTLEVFPTAKYLEGHKSLAGSQFRGDLRVENDLGWKEGIGRLMVFSQQTDPRPIVVMIPPSLAQIYFTKGQSYEGELEVKEGGLIYANSIRKN